MGLATGAARVAEIPTNIDRFSNGCNLGSRWAIEDPKKRKIIRIWCPRWWSHQIRSSSEGIVTQGLYSYLKNNFWVQKMQFRRFLKKIPAATFFVNWFWKWLPRPFQRCRNRQWYILFHLNFILHHCETKTVAHFSQLSQIGIEWMVRSHQIRLICKITLFSISTNWWLNGRFAWMDGTPVRSHQTKLIC